MGRDLRFSTYQAVPEYLADYYPYGKILREWRNCTSERYLTTQHERDIETGYDYRGARFYDSDLGRFLSVDPLAAEYAAWSTYHYVLGNPVRLVDPTGAKIEIPIYNQTVDEDGNEKTEISYIEYTPGMQLTGQKYADAVIISLNGLIEKGADVNGIIDRLANDPNNIVAVNQIHWTEGNYTNGSQVYWSAEGGLVHDDGKGRHSPAVSLLHELGHAYYLFYDFEGKIKEPDTTSPNYLEEFDAYQKKEKEATGIYHNYEDMWIIEKVERPAAEVLGQAKRYSHTSKTKFFTINPFSVEGVEKQ